MGKDRDVYTIYNRVNIVRGGADYFKCIKEIADSARYSLHLQTYIFDEDETGLGVAAALIRAAERGVKVYVLLDGYASDNLSTAFIGRLKEAGIHFGFFEPLLATDNFYIGRRLHHKLVVADASVCVVAGINIANRYNDLGDSKAWLDWALHVEGEVAGQLDEICANIWNRSIFRKKCTPTDRKYRLPLPTEACMVRIRRNDWVHYRTEITRSYRAAFPLAKSYVTMMTSYFWPPKKLLNNMAYAARRGTRIKLILTARSDVKVAKYTERYLYPWLFRNNIEVYEYQPSILHGKIAVRDDEWVTAGSYNVNNISAYASVELNLEVKGKSIAREINSQLMEIIEHDCRKIDPVEFNKKTALYKKFIFYLSYRFVHLVFYLFTFYFVQKRDTS